MRRRSPPCKRRRAGRPACCVARRRAGPAPARPCRAPARRRLRARWGGGALQRARGQGDAAARAAPSSAGSGVAAPASPDEGAERRQPVPARPCGRRPRRVRGLDRAVLRGRGGGAARRAGGLGMRSARWTSTRWGTTARAPLSTTRVAAALFAAHRARERGGEQPLRPPCADETLERLDRVGARVFRTDEQGDVSCESTADAIDGRHAALECRHANAPETRSSLLPVYLVVGEDALKRVAGHEAAARPPVRARATCRSIPTSSTGRRPSAADVVSACNTVPFASPLRLVRGAQRRKLKKPDAEALVSPTRPRRAPPRCSRWRPRSSPKNTRLYKAAAKHGKTAVIDCAPLKRNELPKTVRSMAVGHGVGAHGGCGAPRSVELVGEDTVHLDNEVREDRARAPWRRPGERARDRRPRQPDGRSEAMGVRGCVLGARLAEMPALSGPDEVDVAPCPHRQVHESPARARLRAGAVRPRRARGHRGHAQNARLAMQEPCALGPRVRGGGGLRRALVGARDTERAMKSGSDPDVAFLDWVLAVVPRR